MNRRFCVLAAVATGLFGVRAAFADYIVYSGPDATITAGSAIVDPGNPDPFSIPDVSIDQTHDWNQFGLLYVSGLDGGFNPPVLSAFSPDTFSVIGDSSNYVLTNQIGTDLKNVDETFTVSFAGALPTTPGVFYYYTFYNGIGERDYVIDVSSNGTLSYVGFTPGETEGGSGTEPYPGALSLQQFEAIAAPLPSSAATALSLLGVVGVAGYWRSIKRRQAPVA